MQLKEPSVQAVWSTATTKESRHSIHVQSELHAEKETLQQHVNKFKGETAIRLLVSEAYLHFDAIFSWHLAPVRACL